MIFNSENKVIIDTLNEAEARAFSKFLKSEILRHQRDMKDAWYLIDMVEMRLRNTGVNDGLS